MRFNILNDKIALRNIEKCAFRAGVGYLVFAVSTLTLLKIIGVATIIYNLNDAIANIISSVKNNIYYQSDHESIRSFLNTITLLGILFINKNPIISFLKLNI
jgi:hypothetical protein